MIGAFLLPRFGRFWGWCQGKTSASPCWNSATSRPTMSTLEWFWGLQLGSWKNHGNNSRKVGGITWYNAITIYNCHKSYKYGTITVINPTYNLYSMIYGFTSTCNWNCGPKGGWIADRENPCTSMAVEPWFPGKVFPCIEWWLKCDFCISFATAGWSCFFGERTTWCTMMYLFYWLGSPECCSHVFLCLPSHSRDFWLLSVSGVLDEILLVMHTPTGALTVWNLRDVTRS